MRRWMDRRWRLPEVWCRPLNSVQPMKLPSKTKGLLPHFLLALLLVDLICTFPLRFVLISTGRRSVQLPNGSRAAALSLEYLQFHRCGNGSTTSPVRVSNAVMESCDFQQNVLNGTSAVTESLHRSSQCGYWNRTPSGMSNWTPMRKQSYCTVCGMSSQVPGRLWCNLALSRMCCFSVSAVIQILHCQWKMSLGTGLLFPDSVLYFFLIYNFDLQSN